MIAKAFMKLENPEKGFYSHADQQIRKLQFRIFYSDDDIALYLIKGPAPNIQRYKHRFGSRIKELKDAEMKAEMDKYQPAEIDTCPECLGTGQIEVPAFDPIKRKEDLDEKKEPSK